MCIRHHVHCYVESVVERGEHEVQQVLHGLQGVEEVIELSTLEHHTCLTRSSRTADTVPNGLKHDETKPQLFSI